MEPSIFARFQNAGDCPIERVTVICRHAATTNSEEYVDDGTHAVPNQRRWLRRYFWDIAQMQERASISSIGRASPSQKEAGREARPEELACPQTLGGTSNSFVAATPVQDLRFRANDLLADAKLAAPARRAAGCKPARCVRSRNHAGAGATVA